jgi:metal-responsive CopG/Arc/MetJ family transcriptional regulator
MPKAKVAITIDEDLISRLDRMVKEGKYSNRSQAIQEAVEYRIEAVTKTRLARESAKLDPGYEQLLADEGLEGDLAEWPEY